MAYRNSVGWRCCMKRLIGQSVFWLSGFCLLIPFASAQDEPAPAPPSDIPATTPTAPPAATPAGRGGAANNNEPRPYDRVITKDAKTSEGIFKVHKIRERG